MEKILEEIKKVEREIETYERLRSYTMSRSWRFDIEEKVENGEIITKRELDDYAKRYCCDYIIEKLENKLEDLKNEFTEKKEEFFDYLKKI